MISTRAVPTARPGRPAAALALVVILCAVGQTGLAHLFEHLMFTQTKGQPMGGFDRAIESMGGNSNAMTYYDFTAYLDNVPPDALGPVAALEADRMLNLALDKRQVSNERDVVVEERLGSVEDSEIGRAHV